MWKGVCGGVGRQGRRCWAEVVGGGSGRRWWVEVVGVVFFLSLESPLSARQRTWLQALLKNLLVMSVSGDSELASIMKVVLAGPMLTADKERVIAEITSRVGNDSTGLGSALQPDKAPLQTHLHLQSYLTASDWEFLQRTHVSMSNKLTFVATKCLHMGLHHPHEKSTSHIVGLIVGISQEDSATIPALLGYVREFKTHLRSQLQRMPKLAVMLPVEFPANPQDFKATHPSLYATVYQHEEPIPSKLRPEDLAMMISRVQMFGGCASTVHVGMHPGLWLYFARHVSWLLPNSSRL